VDTFHAKGHVKPACTITSPLCQYHPNLPKFRHLFQPGRNMNTEIAEQSFRKINKTKATTKYMTPWRRMVFLKLLDYSANVALEKSLEKKGLMGAEEKDQTVHEALTSAMTIQDYVSENDMTYSMDSSSESSSDGTNSLCSDLNPSELSNSSLPSINILEVEDDSQDYFPLSGESCEDSMEYMSDEIESDNEYIGLNPDIWNAINQSNSNLHLDGVAELGVERRCERSGLPVKVVEDKEVGKAKDIEEATEKKENGVIENEKIAVEEKGKEDVEKDADVQASEQKSGEKRRGSTEGTKEEKKKKTLVL